ncbi:Ada metal-binding domain-containing protein [Solitalea canadensis]|uniref:Metal binding domain of Ada n=1 Tax=Solitalea canadensis (strain ATCC 29591 / DSM 3403 / JCM 21819 / LMG 8368 / NBRC 15130 / NCIMB 12057 / USAM 9D) TaxID=929556 RepID=H8KSL8_SOLCM|nr:Ada metal-binding domain-containing protein [Solitalea canadensis]AFD08569.1 Metal binding domain of Ada [Solitalea canadensis DSM 3403]
MITHLSLGTETFAANRKLKQLIDNQVVMLGGNKKLKIYGTLTCASGKRMKTENRVFFSSGQEAIQHGYRPCGHCLNHKFKKWKTDQQL